MNKIKGNQKNNKKQYLFGGLAGISSGSIKDSYAVIKTAGGGIAGINGGTIDTSYAVYKGDQLTAIERGNTKNSFLNQFDEETTKSWNFENLWTMGKDNLPVFLAENWYERVRLSSAIEIHGIEDFQQAAKAIADGDAAAARSEYILKNDLDFKNKVIASFGTDAHPFTGKFDGAGHSIRGFCIKGGKTGSVGLFGNIKNALITNLIADGKVKGGNNTGVLIGLAAASQIICCGAAGVSKGYGYTGGLCGQNTGIIDRCNFYGIVSSAVFPLWAMVLIGLLTIELILLIIFVILPALRDTDSAFLPAPIDPNAIIMDDDTAPVTGKNSVTLNFQKKVTFGNGVSPGKLSFKNPGASNQTVMIEIKISDKDLIEKLGKTGRKEGFETDKIEKASDYDPSMNYVTVAETGAIPRGYSIDEVTLIPLPDGTVLPAGTYQATAFLSFFDYKSNEKAMVGSEFGIELEVLE